VTTDIIVGFPGETEENYLETRSLCERVRFDNAFIFRYSKRRGTPAAEMEDALQLSEPVKETRNQDLLDVINDIAKEGYAELVGIDCGDSVRRAEQDEPGPPHGPHTHEQDRGDRGQ